MRKKQIATLIALTILSASAFANPKCNHRAGEGLFAKTNPAKSAQSTQTIQPGSVGTNSGVR